ncbi:vacuolar protein sorting-associated protein 37C isoform X1 [Salmo trutta]|uniref:VPS37C subunit of ESCRT-I n=1 Tax=Salmo trutta TaxID=8032 RepID=A0A674CQL6_SALTR|nr:vacuolar protein sorting-associated protein 37C-like isoform X1 [Salmo trutta]XP_029621976.1 vacuolar protein sorting-associated protein 37C-like isoform X1 [Salmo trutta]XP_029621977.1 vacuolar protein sorting-associated protein 37C-like isoform X1 [Salmo trutta]XP_029621978.1 vacuolar protein sorting-associated protein 37C-like isoform X1 [Salmo trutta]
MDKLQDLSQSELEDLLDNTERVESMALESDEIQNIQLEREMALASNRNLAEQNLDMKPRLERQREHLVERYSELEGVRETYRQHCDQKDGVMGQVSPEGLFSRLQTEGASTETESESLADEFLDGQLSLDSFLDRFLSLRSLAHKRRVRIEKLQEILRQKKETAVGDAGSVTSQTSANQDPATTQSSPWNHHHHHQAPQQQQPQQNSNPNNHSSFQNPSSQNGPGSTLPYTPYPVSPPNPTATSAVSGPGPSIPPCQFPPYPSPGSPFTPAAGYSARPAFGPPANACPYPTQPTFPGVPGSGSAFGQYSAPNSAPYPSAYPYGGVEGYSYPTGPALPNSQSSTGRPLYRPGFGVPQPYS